MNVKVGRLFFRKLSNRGRYFYNLAPIDGRNPHKFHRMVPRCVYESGVFYSTDRPSSPIDCVESFEMESTYSNIDYEAVTEGDENKMKDLKLLQLQVDMLFQQGGKVPSNIKTAHWKELLNIQGKNQRINFLKLLWMNEVRKDNKKRMQALKWEEFEQNKEHYMKPPGHFSNDNINYGLSRVTLFHRIYDTQIDRYYNYRAIMAMMFGQKVLVDCGYEDFMTRREISYCASQITTMWSSNRIHDDPSDILLCNADLNGKLFEFISKIIPNFNDAAVPFNYTPKHYLDLYPREKLVYLTPYCFEELIDIDADTVYILGGVADRFSADPLSTAKAKHDGIRMAKLPLDKYLKWEAGNKSLTLYHVIMILNDMKLHNDWNYALQHVPRKNAFQRYPLIKEEKFAETNAKRAFDGQRRNMIFDMILKERMDKL